MGAYLALSISESSVNAANNTSIVTVNLYYYGNGVSWSRLNPPGQITLDGTSYGFRHNFTKSRGAQWVGAASKTIQHESDGSKYVSVSASFTTGVSLGTMRVSNGATLTKIAVAPTIDTVTFKDFPIAMAAEWIQNIGKSIAGQALGGKMSILGQFAAAQNYGTGTGWHGVSMTKILSEEATNFSLTYRQLMAVKNSGEIGAFAMYALDKSDNLVCGVEVTKSSVGTDATIKMIVGGNMIREQIIDIGENNPYFGTSQNATKTSLINKSNSNILFNCGGINGAYHSDALDRVAISKIEFRVLAYGTSPTITYNGIYSCKLTKNFTSWNDIPNTFTAGDILEINCQEGTVKLNGLDRPDLGALGNDWEKFVLRKGNNQIGLTYSHYASPKARLLYREVYL